MVTITANKVIHGCGLTQMPRCVEVELSCVCNYVACSFPYITMSIRSVLGKLKITYFSFVPQVLCLAFFKLFVLLHLCLCFFGSAFSSLGLPIFVWNCCCMTKLII